MNESFLHYVWQFQYFDKHELQTTDGEPITVLKTGSLNTHAGPDFAEAKIKIGNMEWVGSVEVHIRSSDWHVHHHGTDPAYENVILHLVWENDKPITRGDQSNIPTLVLKTRVAESMLGAYHKLINNSSRIACEKAFARVDPAVKFSMLDKALMQRLEKKSGQVRETLRANRGDWEETTYQWLARNFGFKVNGEPFSQLAKSLPYKIVQKQDRGLQVEALLFGQAGMLLTKTKDEYITRLHQEYLLLSQKYALQGTALKPAQWRFLRLRPANFPTVRLAQLAALLFATKNVFSRIEEAPSYAALAKIFSPTQSEFWKHHYHFGKKSKGEVPGLGDASIQNIAINTVAPIWVAYGQHKDEPQFVDRAVAMLQQLPAEQNAITRAWATLGYTVRSAFDSQALIELYTQFCEKQECLNCNIGVAILKPGM